VIGRRTFVASALAAGTAVGTAGCLGDDDGGDDDGGDDDGGNDGAATADHPALDTPAEPPRLGPPIEEAEGIVVAFDDPSCSSCATFAAETFPQLRDGPVEAGRVTYLARAVPWVEPAWSRLAINALYAVHEAEPSAFWQLKSRFYEEQSGLDEGSIREWIATEAESLPVEPESVLTAVDEGRYDDRIEATESTAEDSEVSVVPSFVLFEGGEYVTQVVGPQPYDVFEGALDL
jgi:protein-disulfide isomerase